MRIMVSSKGTGNRRGRACSVSTGNPVEDKLLQQQQQVVTPTVTPSRPKTTAAQPIAIPDRNNRRRNNNSPRSVQSGSPKGYRSDVSSKSSPQQRASPSCGSFYAGAKFSEAPSAASLPKPPVHWTTTSSAVYHNKDQFQEISNQLKMLLNIKA